jgi:ankyrin repeat protein
VLSEVNYSFNDTTLLNNTQVGSEIDPQLASAFALCERGLHEQLALLIRVND